MSCLISRDNPPEFSLAILSLPPALQGETDSTVFRNTTALRIYWKGCCTSIKLVGDANDLGYDCYFGQYKNGDNEEACRFIDDCFDKSVEKSWVPSKIECDLDQTCVPTRKEDWEPVLNVTDDSPIECTRVEHAAAAAAAELQVGGKVLLQLVLTLAIVLGLVGGLM